MTWTGRYRALGRNGGPPYRDAWVCDICMKHDYVRGGQLAVLIAFDSSAVPDKPTGGSGHVSNNAYGGTLRGRSGDREPEFNRAAFRPPERRPCSRTCCVAGRQVHALWPTSSGCCCTGFNFVVKPSVRQNRPYEKILAVNHNGLSLRFAFGVPCPSSANSKEDESAPEDSVS